MRRLSLASAIVVLLLAGAQAAHAQSVAPSAAVSVPGAEALAAFLNGRAAPGAEQVVPVPSGNGYSLLVVAPADPQQPSWVTTRPARSWFEQENFYSFASPTPPRP
jgi:hypothetical protein